MMHGHFCPNANGLLDGLTEPKGELPVDDPKAGPGVVEPKANGLEVLPPDEPAAAAKGFDVLALEPVPEAAPPEEDPKLNEKAGLLSDLFSFAG